MSIEFNETYDRKKMNKAIEAAVDKGMKKGFYLIEGEAVRNAPIDTSALRQSSEVDINKNSKGIEGNISFNVPYAKIQEENEDFNHPKGGKAHYLRDALRTGLPKTKKYIADELKKIRIR